MQADDGSIQRWLDNFVDVSGLGLTLDRANGTSATLTLPFAERNAIGGVFHGGAIAAALAGASQLLARLAQPHWQRPSPAVLHVQYVRPFAAAAGVIQVMLKKSVPDLVLAEGSLNDSQGRLLAGCSVVLRESTAGLAPMAPPLAAMPGDVAGVDAALQAIPLVARQGIRARAVTAGGLQISISPTTASVNEEGSLRPDLLLIALDAAGATCPWTTSEFGRGDRGATVSLEAQSFAAVVPRQELTAQAIVAAREGSLFWSDVIVLGRDDGRLYARGTVVYRFSTTKTT